MTRLALLLALTLAVVGCSNQGPMLARMDNPAFVESSNYEQVWGVAVDVIERYFDVAYENRYDGRIETDPVVGATFFEPWRRDAVGARQRLESTLQTIRRKCSVLILPAPTGGFLVTVEVYKELEDLPQPIGSRIAGGTFFQSLQPIREEIVSGPVPAGKGWISLGRDSLLEEKIIRELQTRIRAISPRPENQIEFE